MRPLSQLASVAATQYRDRQMEALKRTRGARKGQLTKFSTAIARFDVNTDATILRVKLETLEEIYRELKTAQNSIESEVPETELEHELDERETFTELYTTLKAKLLNLIRVHEPATAPQTPTASQPWGDANRSSEVRLPKLTIPTFSGKIDDFKPFYDLFESTVDKASNLSDAEKHFYLRSHVDGDALQLIKALPLTGENYAEALKMLKDRYENRNLLINTHFDRIHALKPMHSKSGKGLKSLLDDTTMNVKALGNMGISDDKLWSLNLVYLVTNRLDPETRNLWEQENAKSSEPAKFSDLQTFLKTQISILDIMVPTAKPPYPHKSIKTHAATSAETSVTSCRLCNQGHDRLYFCDAFKKLNADQRFEKVKSFNLCVNCLHPDHKTKECSCSTRCRHCDKRHHTLLHRDFTKPSVVKSSSTAAAGPSRIPNSNATTATSSAAQSSTAPNSTALTTNLAMNVNTAVIPTCYAKICGENGDSMVVCVMLDSASDSNYITARSRQYLRLPTVTRQFQISGIAGVVSTASKFAKCTVKSLYSDFSFPLEAPVLSQITARLPPVQLSQQQRYWINAQDIDLPTDRCLESADIDVLLGAQHFFNLLTGNSLKIPDSDLFVIESKLGWFVAGSYCAPRPERLRCHVAVCLEQFWRIEEPPKHQRQPSVEETFAENHFCETLTKTKTGRFQVNLPFKVPKETLGDTSMIAKSRLMSMERKMRREPEFKRLYHEFMKEYLNLGHMSFLCQGISGDGYFLPHHAVLKPTSTTTKLRTVFDGSVTPANGSSLNKALAVGPPLQPDIFTLLLRFRMFPIAIVSDVEKMYRQIQIHPNDTKFQQILWRFESDQPIATYKLNTVTYGTSPASFLAVRCLMNIADTAESTAPHAAAALRENFLMDDFVGGANTIDDAVQLQRELRQVLSAAKFHLRKWNSNEPAALIDIPDADLATQECVTFKDDDIPGKTLGIQWNARSDRFIFSHPVLPPRKTLTKRIILSDFSKFFDPLGICSPIITRSKSFLQELWILKLDWDDEITEDSHKAIYDGYQEIARYVGQLYEFTVPRAVVPRNVLYNEINLHGFCDASTDAYAAVLYIQCGSECNLLCSKTKVAPTRTVSIPRLELCAALLLAQLATSAATDLKLQSITLWSDSSVVLNWLQRVPRSLNTFVANRVAEIQNLTNTCRWRHIPTDLNPADVPTRPISPDQLRDHHLWWHGPEFLVLPQDEWPPSIIEFIPNLPEQKARVDTTTLCAVQPVVPPAPAPPPDFLEIFLRYSSYRKLLNVSAYVYRFLYNCRVPLAQISGPLTPAEVQAAKLCLVKIIQRVEFPKTYQLLKNNQSFTKKNELFKITPFLDEDAVIRVRGRLGESNLPYGIKHPIVIPAKHPFAALLIRYTHLKYKHAGPLLTLNMIKQEFWIVNGAKTRIREIIGKCAVCIRYGSNDPRPPIMGEVPPERTAATYPFETTGLDYAGPFTVRLKRDAPDTTMHIYVAIFVCMTVKAVHLEIVDDLTTASFIASLRNFTGRRGTPRKILSDNSTTFTKASGDLNRAYAFLRTHAAGLASALTAEGIEWHYIPPHAPHMGGMWEAAVKSMKFHLKRAIGRQVLGYLEFKTLLVQVEMCLNSRPLTAVTTDPRDEMPLTPFHFLTLRPPGAIPDDNTHHTTTIYKRWAHVQNVVLDFWSKWSIDYLNTLQLRTKWRDSGRPYQIGDIVLVREDNAPPACWNMGRITQLYPGQDGNARVAEIKTQTTTLRRPVVKLIPLVTDENVE